MCLFYLAERSIFPHLRPLFYKNPFCPHFKLNFVKFPGWNFYLDFVKLHGWNFKLNFVKFHGWNFYWLISHDSSGHLWSLDASIFGIYFSSMKMWGI